MKIFKVMMVALAAILGLSSCDKHECDDHSADLVGTWTYIGPGYAEALVISADGSVVSTGCDSEDYWENVNGKIVVKDGKVTMSFDDNDDFEGHFDIIPGEAFSIYNEDGERMTYRYCKEDLSEEIVGMWVCNNVTSGTQEMDMRIKTYHVDGSITLTGFTMESADFLVNAKGSTYKVIGDLIIDIMPEAAAFGADPYACSRIVYSPNGTSLGDILTLKGYLGTEELTSSWLRVKESLNLAGKKYDYSNLYVTNVKGLDKEIEFVQDYKFNFAKMDGKLLDQILKSILFNVEFPDAKTFKYGCSYPVPNTSLEAPMVVEGNKITVKMSQRNAAFRDIDLYSFQDADGCQLHMYMSTNSFISFYGNMQIMFMTQLGSIDTTDEAAVKAVFESIDDVVETINVSFVMKYDK